MTIGWHFDNSYYKLPKSFREEIDPVPVKKPELIVLNENLAKSLGLDFSNLNKDEISHILSGNDLPKGSNSIAQAYAGHQFGHFTMLGDGRAVLIGEHISKSNERFDIQFKGSGKTSFSRSGDGRAALGPMLREYIISEALHFLDIPTTRSLARLLVVGMSKKCKASLIIYSLNIGPRAALPSPLLEKEVLPEPLN